MNRLWRACVLCIVITSTARFDAQSTRSNEWARFRGPNVSGVSTARGVPTTFNRSTNFLWRLDLPPGHSSPIVFGDRLYLTAFRGDKLFTIAVDRTQGTILWEREGPTTAKPVIDKRNS